MRTPSIRTSHSAGSLKKTKQGQTISRKCNLCRQGFAARTVFDRFCPTCKEQSELLKFGDCFPEFEDVIAECASA